MRLSVLSLVATLAVSDCSAPTGHAADQLHPAMFRGGPEHRGRYSGGLPHFGGLQWRVRTGGPVRSSPAVFGDAVYVGSGDGNLYAINRLTGTVRWRQPAGSGIASSPAVTDRAVFVATEGGALLAFARADGKQLWRRRFGPDAELAWGRSSGDAFTSSPVLGTDGLFAAGGDGVIYAIDPANGRVRWQYQTGGRVRSSPAVVNGVLYAGSYDGMVYAVDAGTGSLRWKFATLGAALNSADFGYDRRSIQASPAVADGLVYIGSRDGNFYAIDAASGTLKWKYPHDDTSWSISSPAVGDSLVFGGSSDAHFFHALRQGDGTQAWRLATPGSVWSSPALAGGLVYFGDGSGMVHAVDELTGTERWRYRTGGSVLSSPAVADGILYVGSGDGGIYAIRGGERELTRAVFWDSLAIPANTVRSHRQVKDALAARGYQVLDSAGLGGWLRARTADQAPSVVVFAMDYLPRDVMPVAADSVLFRRYLNTGGKVVWLGIPPAMWPAGVGGDRSYASIRWEAPEKLRGVNYGAAQFDRFGATATATGEAWGLSGWWLSSWAVEPQAGLEVLATDEHGLAAAFGRSYRGPAGTGFVQAIRADWGESALLDLAAVAEYRPRDE